MPGCSNQGCKVTDVLRCQWQTWCGQLSSVCQVQIHLYLFLFSAERDGQWTCCGHRGHRTLAEGCSIQATISTTMIHIMYYINSKYRSDCCCGQPCREGSLTMGRCHTSLTDNWFHLSEFENFSPEILHYLRIWARIKGNGWKNDHVWDVSVTHHQIILAVCLQKPLLKQWPWGDVTYHWLTTYCKDPCLASRNSGFWRESCWNSRKLSSRNWQINQTECHHQTTITNFVTRQRENEQHRCSL